MRVLGVDPGLTRCGLGVVEGSPGRAVRLLGVEVVRTAGQLPLGERLAAVERALLAMVERYRPEAAAVEQVFSQHNVRTVMSTAQVSGVAMLAASRAGLPVSVHTPSEVKAAVTGSGGAGKGQVATMVARLLGLPAPPQPADATDALALAICALWRGAAQRRLEATAGAAAATATPGRAATRRAASRAAVASRSAR